MRKTAFFMAPILLAATALAGCASDSSYDRSSGTVYEPRSSGGYASAYEPAPAAPRYAAACANCATITRIERAEDRGGNSAGGMVAGAIIGGVIGHQFGSGRGNDAATIGGAAVGAYAGNEIAKEHNARVFYRVSLAMDNGAVRDMNIGDPSGLRVGSRVRVYGNDLELA